MYEKAFNFREARRVSRLYESAHEKSMRWEPARGGERGRFWGKALYANSLAAARELLLRTGGAGAGMARPIEAELKGGIRAAVQGRVTVKVEEAAEILLLYTVNARYRRVRFRLHEDGFY